MKTPDEIKKAVSLCICVDAARIARIAIWDVCPR